MFHYLFEDYYSGEMFLVGADNVGEAYRIAEDNFADPHYVCEYTEEEAENSILDEF